LAKRCGPLFECVQDAVCIAILDIYAHRNAQCIAVTHRALSRYVHAAWHFFATAAAKFQIITICSLRRRRAWLQTCRLFFLALRQKKSCP
jgi:DNA-binding MurR/RpiR family transcriptional regulator